MAIFSFYTASMMARELDFRKDSFFGESMGGVPFKYNFSKNAAVTQSIVIKNHVIVHRVYLFKFYGFFYQKKLIFMFEEGDNWHDYHAKSANSWLAWRSDDQLIIATPSTKKITVQEYDADGIQINYLNIR
ncbi:hypothetical protein [Moraxella marmotae]|uniref:hypothetical protein n=1 Tax=Moraxella marmotae TaxID=3344520 RepID=UPI003671DE19